MSAGRQLNLQSATGGVALSSTSADVRVSGGTGVALQSLTNNVTITAAQGIVLDAAASVHVDADDSIKLTSSTGPVSIDANGGDGFSVASAGPVTLNSTAGSIDHACCWAVVHELGGQYRAPIYVWRPDRRTIVALHWPHKRVLRGGNRCCRIHGSTVGSTDPLLDTFRYVQKRLPAEAPQESCKSRTLKWATLRNLFCNGRVIYGLCEGSCTYVYTNATCLSTLMATYPLLLLTVTSSKMGSLPTKSDRQRPCQNRSSAKS
jgi:hypothetical protein